MSLEEATTYAAVIAAIAAIFTALITVWIARQQRKQNQQLSKLRLQQERYIAEQQQRKKGDELFLKGLEFLGGKTQVRNLGVAALGLYWKDNQRYQRLCIEILIGSAIYLIDVSGQTDKSHEIYNLRRIMNLVLRDIPYDRNAKELYEQLMASLRKWKPKKEGDKGLHIAQEEINKWKSNLDRRLS